MTRSVYRFVGVVASALALGACGTVLKALDPIQLKVERSTTYYDVRGVTSDEIIEYLDTGKLLAKDIEDEDIMFATPGATAEYWEGEE